MTLPALPALPTHPTLLLGWVGIVAATVLLVRRDHGDRRWLLAAVLGGPTVLLWARVADGKLVVAVGPYLGAAAGGLTGLTATAMLPPTLTPVALYAAVFGGAALAVAARGQAVRRLTRLGGPGLGTMAGTTLVVGRLIGRVEVASPAFWLTLVTGLAVGALAVPTATLAVRRVTATVEVAP